MCGWCKQPVPTPVGVIFKVYICLNIIVLGLITITDSIDIGRSANVDNCQEINLKWNGRKGNYTDICKINDDYYVYGMDEQNFISVSTATVGFYELLHNEHNLETAELHYNAWNQIKE